MRRLLGAMLVIAVGSAAYGEMYTWKDRQGTAHYTNSIHEIPARYLRRARVLDVATGKLGGPATQQTAGASPAGPGLPQLPQASASAASVAPFPVAQPPSPAAPVPSPSGPSAAVPQLAPSAAVAAPPLLQSKSSMLGRRRHHRGASGGE